MKGVPGRSHDVLSEVVDNLDLGCPSVRPVEDDTPLAVIRMEWKPFPFRGPIVLCQSYRNPALLAKMGGALLLMSGGAALDTRPRRSRGAFLSYPFGGRRQ